MANSDHGCLIAAAIHIGENYSSWAYSFAHDFRSDPGKVYTPVWLSSSLGLSSTPTYVLFTKDKKFSAFGYEAEEKYNELTFDDNQRDYYYFRNFRTKLLNQTILSTKCLLEDETGKTMSTIEVLSACIKYLRENLLDKRVSSTCDILSDIKWIITVPAVSTGQYMEFIRISAERAGIRGEQLFISRESEATNWFCRYIFLTEKKFIRKAKFLVLDAGDDVIDITIHEIQTGNSLSEIFTTRYEDCGGYYANKAFLGLLADMYGNDVMDKFKTENMKDYSDLLFEIETRKRLIKNYMHGKFTFKIPISLNEAFRRMVGKQLSDHIETVPRYKGRVQVALIGDKLRLDVDLVKSLYKDTCEIIVGHLKNAFKKDLSKDISTIVMIGSFSESEILSSLISETFPDMRIIRPEDPGLAVLKGAVIFGHELLGNISRFTPGYFPTRFSEK